MVCNTLYPTYTLDLPPSSHPVPCTLYPVPCTLYPVPCTLYPVPCTLYPAPCTLYPVPCTLYPAPCTLYPVPCTLYPVPNLHPGPDIFLPPCTLYPAPCTLHPVPCTLTCNLLTPCTIHLPYIFLPLLLQGEFSLLLAALPALPGPGTIPGALLPQGFVELQVRGGGRGGGACRVWACTLCRGLMDLQVRRGELR